MNALKVLASFAYENTNALQQVNSYSEITEN